MFPTQINDFLGWETIVHKYILHCNNWRGEIRLGEGGKKKDRKKKKIVKVSLRAGFEPARGDPIGFQVQRLNHSAITARRKDVRLLNICSFAGVWRETWIHKQVESDPRFIQSHLFHWVCSPFCSPGYLSGILRHIQCNREGSQFSILPCWG